MGAWSDLPTELALQVIKELSVPDRRDAVRNPSHTTNLLSCTQVSHNFRAIADMVLYRDVHLILPDSSYIYPRHKAAILYRQILRFTRAILLRPSLGKHVRQLFVSSLGGEWDEFESTLASWNEPVSEGETQELLSDHPNDGPDLSIILKALEPLGLKTGLVQHGGADGHFITLLQLLPKLQSLSVEAKGPLNFIAYSCFGAFGGKVPTALQSIVELSISVDPVGDYDTDGGFDTEELLAFMTLPSLRRMTMSRYYGGHPPRIRIARAAASNKSSSITKFSRGYAIRAMSSAITALYLQSSSASCEIVAEVLRLPLHLTTFEYRISSKVEKPSPFNASELLPGLERHASSLRELTLVTELIEYHWDDDAPFIRSLSAFGALETLRVSLPIIFEGAEWFSMIDEPRDEDDEDDDSDDRGDLPAWRRPSRYPAWNCHQLLPPNLSSLELQVHPDAFLTFIKRSGLPQSLTVTRKHIPSLAKFSVTGASGYLEPLDHLLAQVPVLDPRMSVTFDGISNTS